VLKRLIETSSEELKLQGSNKNLMLKYQRLLQRALLRMKILAQVLPYIQDLKSRLNDKHISPFLEALHWPNTLKRKFKRNTEKMPFVITWIAWRSSFQEKETRKNKNLLTWKERRTEKRKDKNWNKRIQRVNLQGGARNVIPLIVHITHFYYYKGIWHLVQN